MIFQRAAAFRRQSSAASTPADRPPEARPTDAGDGLTRAQARAQSRCEPLTPAEFKARRRVADQGLVSLAGVLDEGADARTR